MRGEQMKRCTPESREVACRDERDHSIALREEAGEAGDARRRRLRRRLINAQLVQVKGVNRNQFL